MPVSARQLVKDISHLVSLPDVCLHIGQVLEDPNSSAMDMADLVSRDPALTARLLKIANSPYFGFPSKIDTLSRAITIIGTQDLYQLVLATAAIDSIENTELDAGMLEKFWQHSLMTGLISRDLARKSTTPVMHVERMFVAGLLHDIGSLVMAIRIPELSKVMLRCADKLDMSISQAERNIFDLDHGEVGAELMANWQLPGMMQDTARFHHEPELSNNHQLEISLVHMANWASMTATYSRFDFDYDEPLSDFAMNMTGIGFEEVKQAINIARKEFLMIERSFFSREVSRKAG